MNQFNDMPWWARFLAGLAAAAGTGYLAAEIPGAIAASVAYLGGVNQKRPVDVHKEQNGS